MITEGWCGGGMMMSWGGRDREVQTARSAVQDEHLRTVQTLRISYTKLNENVKMH